MIGFWGGEIKGCKGERDNSNDKGRDDSVSESESIGSLSYKTNRHYESTLRGPFK